MTVIAKAVPVLLREKRGRREILAFRHPVAGVQIVKGTIEPGEAPEAAALRELEEESGVTGARLVRPLGASSSIDPGQEWHFFLCDAAEQPARWVYLAADDGGHIFSFFWHPLDDDAGDDWHYAARAALSFIRDAMRAG